MLSNFENIINEYKVFDSKYYYSINKAKKLNKKLFIIKISPENMNE